MYLVYNHKKYIDYLINLKNIIIFVYDSDWKKYNLYINHIFLVLFYRSVVTPSDLKYKIKDAQGNMKLWIALTIH